MLGFYKSLVNNNSFWSPEMRECLESVVILQAENLNFQFMDHVSSSPSIKVRFLKKKKKLSTKIYY